MMDSCKHTNHDEEKSGNLCPEEWLLISFHTIGNDGMYNPNQTADTKANASENPELKQICEDICKNNNDDR